MLVQLVGFMKEVNVSKSSKVTLVVIISRVLVLWLYKTVTLLNLCWVIFARSCSGWIDVEEFAGEIIGGTIAHPAPMLRGQYCITYVRKVLFDALSFLFYNFLSVVVSDF